MSEASGPVKVLDQYLSESKSGAQNQAETLALAWACRRNGPCAKHSFSMWSQPCPLYKTSYIQALGGRGIGGHLLPSCQKGQLLKTFPLIRVKWPFNATIEEIFKAGHD